MDHRDLPSTTRGSISDDYSPGRCNARPRGLAFSGGTDYVSRTQAPPMTRTLIDPLRFADRLEEAGFLGLPFRS